MFKTPHKVFFKRLFIATRLRPRMLATLTLISAVLLAYRVYWSVGYVEVRKNYHRVGSDLGLSSTYNLEKLTLPSVNVMDKIKIFDLSEESGCDELCQLKVQDYRQKVLRDQCLSLGYKESITYKNTVTEDLLRRMDHFIVSDRHKVIYCYIPKVGCTNWKKIFLVLEGVVSPDDSLEHQRIHILSDGHLKLLSGYKVNDAVRRLETFKMFIFVRNPFARLLSGYKDKVEKPTKDNSPFREDWNHYISLNLANKSASFRESYDTFRRYARYLSKHEVSNEHWIDMHKLSFPCQVKFDFIGKMETVNRDTKFVIDNILHADQQIVSYGSSTNPTNSNETFYHYFGNLPVLEMIALYERFRVDFSLFGYQMPKVG